MKVVVRFFAAARDLAGSGELTLDVPLSSRVGDVRQALAAQVPRLAPLLARCKLAVADDFATDDQLLPPDAVVAILPPVGGG